MANLLYAPLAFLIYIGLVACLMGIGKVLASDAEDPVVENNPVYASGENETSEVAASGYQGFSQFALFFAIFHLGVILLATGGFTLMTGIFLAFLALLLLVLLV